MALAENSRPHMSATTMPVERLTDHHETAAASRGEIIAQIGGWDGGS